MKASSTPLKRLATNLSLAVIACASVLEAGAQISVAVDSTLPWQGYVNVWQTNGTNYVFGSAWGVDALRSELVNANSTNGWPLHTALILRPNTNTYAPGTGTPPDTNYWNFSDGRPNKVVEANYYRDVGTAYAGQSVTFSGVLISNNVPPVQGGMAATGWEVLAVVKEFTASYGWIGMSSVPLTTPGPFTVNKTIAAGHVCQYGFIVKGPNTAPLSPDSFAGVGIVVQDSDPAITNQPTGATITSGIDTQLKVGAIGSATLAYYWKADGNPLTEGSKFTGVNTSALTIHNAQVADAAAYTVLVSNTVTHATLESGAAQLKVLDIVVTASPADLRVEQGSTATFKVAASSSSPLTYRWKYVLNGVTNFVSGANASGTNTDTLTLSNVQPTNSGVYIVTISTASGSADAAANLLVKAYADYANMLENPGFENDPSGLNETPWNRFESTDRSWGHFQSATDVYFGGGNVNVREGKYVSYTSYNGAYSGIYQDVPASPGQVFTADMWFYNASGDPIPGPDPFMATNENYLEIQFRAGDDPMPIRQYLTTISALTYAVPTNVWFQLQATNAGSYGYNPSTVNTRYLVAPEGTTKVRFQLTMHDIANSMGAGSIYYDSARLMLKLPVTVSVTQSGGNTVLSWNSLGSTDYQVQYKDDLNGQWQNLGGVVAGTGQVVTKSDPSSSTSRFYRVLTL